MLEVAIMVEGQEGIGWDRWRRIARAVEDSGYAGLYRSEQTDGLASGCPGAVDFAHVAG